MASLFDLVGNYNRARDASMKRQIDGATFNQGVVKQQGADFTKFIKSANSDLEADALNINNIIDQGGNIADLENKPAGFESNEQFKTWYQGTGPGTGFANKKYSGLGDTNLSDYVAMYGHKGTFRKLNEMGFGSALLGPNKQFDPENSTIRENAETGEMEIVPYVRTNSQARKQSYSSPMTVGGKDIRDIITEFGPEAAEQSIVGLSLGDLNTVFQEYAKDVEIGGGGNPAVSNLAPMTQIPWGSSDRVDIEQKIEQRVNENEKRVGGQPVADAMNTATEFTQGGQQTSTTPAPTPAPTSAPASVTETAKDFPVVDPSKYAGVLTTMYNAQRQELGTDFYMGPGDAEALYNQLTNTTGISKNVRDKTIENYKTIANRNLKAKVNDQILNYFGGKMTARGTTLGGGVPVTAAGRLADAKSNTENPISDENYAVLEKKANWYKANEDKLIDKLKGNPELYNEFVQNPDAFVTKYVDDKNFFASPVQSADRKVISSAAQNTGLNVNTKAVVNAVETGDNQTATKLLLDSVQGKNHSAEDDEAIAGVITKYNGNFAELDKARRVTLAAELLAGMPDSQRDGNFAKSMINMIETGDMTMTTPQAAAAQAADRSDQISKLNLLRNLSKDAAEYAKPGDVTKQVLNIREEILGINTDDPLVLSSGNLGDLATMVTTLVQAAEGQTQSPQEMKAALGLGLTVLDKYYEIEAEPTWWQELMTLGFAEGPESGGFNFTPNFRAYDVDGNVTTDPVAIVSFGTSSNNTVSANKIKKDLRAIGMDMFYKAMENAIAENG